MASTARSLPRARRAPASVNVDLILDCSRAGIGCYLIEAARSGEAERRVLHRLAEALHGAPLRLARKGAQALRGGRLSTACRWSPGAGIGPGVLQWALELELPEAPDADLAPVLGLLEGLQPGGRARVSVHVRPDGEPLAREIGTQIEPAAAVRVLLRGAHHDT